MNVMPIDFMGAPFPQINCSLLSKVYILKLSTKQSYLPCTGYATEKQHFFKDWQPDCSVLLVVYRGM